MKSRSNNSLDMSVNDQKPSNDSLIYKSEINELEEIKTEDSYEKNETYDLKEHIIHNDSDENYEENSEENDDNFPSIFSKSKISQKDIKEICQANYNADVSASELIAKNIPGISSSTVYRHYQSLREKGTSNRKIGSGRKSILSADSKKLILKQIKNADTQTPEEISEILKENNYKGSPKTIRKFIKKEGFLSKPPVESYELSKDQKRIRKKWCIDHKDYDWKKSSFTDETVFKIGEKKQKDC